VIASRAVVDGAGRDAGTALGRTTSARTLRRPGSNEAPAKTASSRPGRMNIHGIGRSGIRSEVAKVAKVAESAT
jgi:hypothetical protein